ncbi:MAG: stage IV sporulation protein A, partial [Clostridia bacterium]|nr:stage IV sporulation protein A [Clostridia bacterium]
LFYRTLSQTSGMELADELQLMQFVCELADIKRGYDKVKDALAEADKNGYGIVYPAQEDYRLDQPQLIKKSAGYGVQFKANASSYHIVKVDISGAVSPIIGTKQQGEDFVGETRRAYEEDGEAVWETNIFGKSLRDLVGDELAGKSNAMPIELRKKMRRVMTRIVNEGKNNVLCLLF